MSSSHDQFIELDPNVWKGFAGSSVVIPSVGQNVYYFPERHAEHSISPILFSPSVKEKPMILCRVLGVKFLANALNHQIFATIQLVPIADTLPDLGLANDAASAGHDMFYSFTKKLTWSDDHSDFLTLPKSGTEFIFPSLNSDDDPFSQTISFKDVQGVYWNFLHVYSGAPDHLLHVHGWRRFANTNWLREDDSITFMKNKTTNEYYIGFSRRISVKVLPNSIIEPAKLAVANKPFQVFYYPTAGSAFVVSVNLIRNEAMSEPPPIVNQSLEENNNTTNASNSIHLSRNEAMSEPSPIVKESVEEELTNTNNSSSSFNLFGKIIHLNPSDSLPKQ